MITLHWPWLLFLLPLPLLVYFLFPAQQSTRQVIRFPFLSASANIHSKNGLNKTAFQPLVLLAFLSWGALVLAATRPIWIGDPIYSEIKGRNLMLAVDISWSMQENDLSLNGKPTPRLTVVKEVVKDFVKQREGDRLGLVVFGTQAFLHVPLTFDRDTVNEQLADVEIGMAGRNTAIGDAIGLSIKRLQNQPLDQRILILLTDGANTAGEIDPVQAAKLAALESVKIYTIGIGADYTVRQTFFGPQYVNPSADLDEEALKEIAKLTGGKYFRAKNTEDLQKVYESLNELEPKATANIVYRPQKELFFWPLGFALITSFLFSIFYLIQRR